MKRSFVYFQLVIRKSGWLIILGLGLLSFLTVLEVRSASSADSKPTWQLEWEKTVNAAQREGQVNVYMVGYGPVLNEGVFQKRYPGIKVLGMMGKGGESVQRILAERRAGKYIADVFGGGVASTYENLYLAKMLDPINSALILPEVVDESRWWQRRHRYADPEAQYVFRYVGAPQGGSISYNTNLVNPREFKSLWDFLDPKWKGKIEARDVRGGGAGGGNMRFFYYSPELGPLYIKRLFGEMNVTLFRDFRQGTDWLATGKFAICFFCRGIDQAKSQGLPVDEFGLMKEGAGITAGGGTLALLNRAPHPNAARVFINWLLSREGQITLQKALIRVEGEAVDSLRIDIPKENIHPRERRQEGVQYIDLDTPERFDRGPAFKVFEEALVEAKK